MDQPALQVGKVKVCLPSGEEGEREPEHRLLLATVYGVSRVAFIIKIQIAQTANPNRKPWPAGK